MASHASTPAVYALQRIPAGADQDFKTPTKRINDGDDLAFFFSSTAYSDLMRWLLQLNRSMFPTKDAQGQIQICTLDNTPIYSESVETLRRMLSGLGESIQQAPPDQGPRRFGNVAFRTWFKLADESTDELMETHLRSVLDQVHVERRASLKDELRTYFLGAFGSAQRLDYGTGHELSFIAFLGCLWKIGAFQDGEERAIVVGVVQPYLELIRRLVLTYTLEPAGSHGVWGLDDHSFVPYIFGSAQYGRPIDPNKTDIPIPTEGSVDSAPSPSDVANKTAVRTYQASNMYFSAIQFIYDVKRGPFWEHSPVLYDVSGIKDGWAKINKGMLKMYAAEVLGKFPVVQHFGFGSFFRWEADPDAVKGQGSVHAQQQPSVGKARSMDAPPPPRGSTRAPWAGAGAGGARSATSPGMPSTKAPWAGISRAPPGAAPMPASGVRTAAPWASGQVPRRDLGNTSRDHG